jgi:hypothetical protein
MFEFGFKPEPMIVVDREVVLPSDTGNRGKWDWW